MNETTKKTGFHIFLLLLVPMLSGCTSLFFSHSAKTMYDGEVKPHSEIALVAGQGYKASFGDFHQVMIKKVDDRDVYTFWSLKPVYLVYVEPGKHKLKLWSNYGSQLYSLENEQEIYVEVEAGKAYQIYSEILKQNGNFFIKHRYLEIGTISDYHDYFKKNPNVPKGSPVPIIRTMK
jgi:hypothetical protein